MKGYSKSFLILLRATALKSDAKLPLIRPIFGNESRFYSDVATVANKADLTSAAVKSAAPLNDLLGRRHDYLRISLTERCNLRCQYCMPAEGVSLTPKPDLLTKEELYRLVNVFASLGVHKIRLTGGEPTLRSDLAEIIEQLCSVPGIRNVAMTTNGLVLTRRLPAYQRAGLSAINVSLDSLQPDKYERMARRPGLKKVLAGIDLALQLGYRPVKVNTVLMRGFNDDEICDFVEFTRDREVEVRFIEFMPFSGNRWDDSHMVPHEEALRAVRLAFPRLAPTLPRACDTAAVWQVEGHAGSVGFISSMTQPFCSSCNRLRLTADGNLKVCLFGAAEVSLRAALRAGASDAEVETLIRTALRNKKPQHAGMQNLARMENRPMILIGG
ncbi:Molybdopterin biosynthesis protein CNX2 [Papilio xuthus]|uniref:GTP 3',8-cyclase n=1 Tax=Papilio xuthus TaxID=66420 RepID=A0A194PT13_PAPXU|nr:Molybdopterin biosynthesis protein CNX2 [Papilio xuthus]